jgi:nucleosome binding factor SPN SPT16 subunit
LYVDKNFDSILVPINNNSFVPFHISTIKNVSTTNEG